MRNLGSFGLLLLFLAGQTVASSNHIDPKTKARIITRVSNLIQTKAFAFEIAFDRWPEILQSRRKTIDLAETVNEFEDALDRAFDEFEISHLYITPPKIKASDPNRPIIRFGISGLNTESGIYVTHVTKERRARRTPLSRMDPTRRTHVRRNRLPSILLDRPSLDRMAKPDRRRHPYSRIYE